MIPLCTTATRPLASVCGCALTSVAGPWVAHRVWPMPTLPANRFGRRVGQVAHPAGPLAPTLTPVPPSTASPAES